MSLFKKKQIHTPRCSYTHPRFSNCLGHRFDIAESGFGVTHFSNPSPRCWVTDLGNFGTKEIPEFYCVFHAPLDKEPVDRNDWEHRKTGYIQAKQLRTLLDEWNAENIRRSKSKDMYKASNPLEFMLPGMRCIGIDLSGYTFSGPVDFESSTIIGGTFESAIFCDHASFESVTFSHCPNFNSTAFKGGVDFDAATFEGTALFVSTAFSSRTSFNTATFCDDAYFLDATFNGSSAKFVSTIFNGIVNFKSATFSADAIFDTTNFYKKAVFINAQFDSSTVFSNSLFKAAPEFHDAKLHQGSDFRGTTFKDKTSRGAPSAYRTLKLAMGNVQSRKEEMDFYALEQESIRKQPDTPLSDNIFSTLYLLFSDYGRSFVRPLAWLLGIIAWFIPFYGVLLLIFAKPVEQYPFIIQFAIEQVIRPFNIWTTKGAEKITALADGYTLLFQCIASVQSLLSISLITLFLLAVRRRFKLS